MEKCHPLQEGLPSSAVLPGASRGRFAAPPGPPDGAGGVPRALLRPHPRSRRGDKTLGAIPAPCRGPAPAAPSGHPAQTPPGFVRPPEPGSCGGATRAGQGRTPVPTAGRAMGREGPRCVPIFSERASSSGGEQGERRKSCALCWICAPRDPGGTGRAPGSPPQGPPSPFPGARSAKKQRSLPVPPQKKAPRAERGEMGEVLG